MTPREINLKPKLLKLVEIASLLFFFCCFCSLPGTIRNVEAGGKGKGGRQGHIIIQNEVKSPQQVPIYIPMPIPIPVPAGPPQGGTKFSHHQQPQQQRQFHPQQQQQHQHDSEDEGEVKKIYLLHPVQKLQPQPQLKGGGFMGPVQTHIHMSAPPQVHQQPQQQQRHHYHRANKHSASYEAEERPAANKHQQQQPELKILPIVVIPPIAPMPPIQLPPTNYQAQAPKMTLTPQFNNYVVTASERSHNKKRMPPGGHISVSLQDQKSFSDYNLAGANFNPVRDSGSSHHRMMMRARMRARQAQTRPGRAQSADNLGSHYGSATSLRTARIRQQMIDEDSMDDFDHNNNMRYAGVQSSRMAPKYTASASTNAWANRQRRQQQLELADLERARSTRLNSAPYGRDPLVVEQQTTLFDDEPSSMAEPSRDNYNSINRDPAGHQQLISSTARRFRQFVDGSDMSPLMIANSDQSRDVTTAAAASGQLDRDYEQGLTNESFDVERSRSAPAQLEQSSLVRDHEAPVDDYQRAGGHKGDPNSVYYDRDSLDQNHSFQSDGASNRDRRVYQPGASERELLEDDEWRFDTIKSVAHLDPKANLTSTNSTTRLYNTTSADSANATLAITLPPQINSSLSWGA